MASSKIKSQINYKLLGYFLFGCLIIIFLFIEQNTVTKAKILKSSMLRFFDMNRLNDSEQRKPNPKISIAGMLSPTEHQNYSSTEFKKQFLTFTDSRFIYQNRTWETTIRCVGSLYNQSCLYHNLYFVDGTFMILTVNGNRLPPYSVRTDAFVLWPTTPKKRVFESYQQLEHFVQKIIDPRIIPSVTVYFGQYWHFNIGHALFDGLYPAYVALIRFAPRHLQPFRVLVQIEDCNDCWSEDVYSRFGGLGLMKMNILNILSKGRWLMFEELVMGSGTLCQRCTQPNLQLPGGVELDGSRLFRDRMYRQHGLVPPTIRQNSSSERRTIHDILVAYIIDNKRFTSSDQTEIQQAIHEINNYTDLHLNKSQTANTSLEYPLVRVFYLFYDKVRVSNYTSIEINKTSVDSRSPTYELIENNFMAQLRILRQTDIHLAGPGTGQMYQTFLPDGSVFINLGYSRPRISGRNNKSYSSYLEQTMTSGTPYIKGLYYPINERQKGIKKDEVVKLIRQASQLILKGFSLPVNPRDNLAVDGQLFVEMCERDKEFCSSVTMREPNRTFSCLDFWVEDVVHESRQWNLDGFTDQGRKVICPINRTLLYELRAKYGIEP